MYTSNNTVSSAALGQKITNQAQSSDKSAPAGIYREKTKLPAGTQQKRLTQLGFLKEFTPKPTKQPVQNASSLSSSVSSPQRVFIDLEAALKDEASSKRQKVTTSRHWDMTTTTATMNLSRKGTSTVMVERAKSSTSSSSSLRTAAKRTTSTTDLNIFRSNNKRPASPSSSNTANDHKKPLFNDPDHAFKDAYGSETPKAPRIPHYKSNDPASESKVELSGEQKEILDRVEGYGDSIFFTGSAGTGKSLLLREIIRRLKHKFGGSSQVAVTAPTGIAACNIRGCTLHSFAGVGLAQGSAKELATKILKFKKIHRRWLDVKVLIIDEISMVDGDFFDKLEAVARAVRGSAKAFGGIQLVLCGDYFQLPPVNKADGQFKFCFEAQAWKKCIKHIYHLKHVYRQKDNSFVNMLNELRIGKMSPGTEKLFYRLQREPFYPNDGILPTYLFPRREDVDAANSQQLCNLTGPIYRYKANDTGRDKFQVEKLPQNCIAPTTLELKLNSQVMLLKNYENGLVNGSLGRVIDFKYDTDPSNNISGDVTTKWPYVRFQNGREMLITPHAWTIEVPTEGEVARREQVPLLLAWAMSIHKSQGQTLERVIVDLRRVFEKGQAYVALSRATSLSGIQVLGFHPSKVMAHPRVIQYYQELNNGM